MICHINRCWGTLSTGQNEYKAKCWANYPIYLQNAGNKLLLAFLFRICHNGVALKKFCHKSAFGAVSYRKETDAYETKKRYSENDLDFTSCLYHGAQY